MSASYSIELSQVLSDWRNHLSGSYLFFDHEGEKQPLYVEQVNTDVEFVDEDEHDNTELTADNINILGRTLVGGEENVGRYDMADLSMDFPRLGMMDAMEDTPTKYLYYRARRQFRKSLNDGLVSTSTPHNRISGLFFENNPRRNGLRRRMRRDRVLTLEGLYQIINSKYGTLDECMESIMEAEAPNRALSRNFGLFATEVHEHPVIVYRNIDVGYVKDGPVFYEQYADMIQEFEEQVAEGVIIHE